MLLLSGLEKGRKDLAKSQERCGKDVYFLYTSVWASAISKSILSSSNACERGRRWGKAIGKVIKIASKPINSLLSRRQKQKKRNKRAS